MHHVAVIVAARNEQKRQAAALEAAAIAVYDAIRDGAAAGMRQSELVTASGFTREHVRRIVGSKHGTAPSRTGKLS